MVSSGTHAGLDGFREDITPLDPKQLGALRRIREFYADTEDTLRVRTKAYNFVHGIRDENSSAMFLLTGEARVGKTTVLHEILNHDLPMYEGWDPKKAVMVSLQKVRTTRDATITILETLNDGAIAGNAGGLNLELRLQRILKARGYRLLVLDEFQHMLDNKSLGALKGLTDWLKVVVDKSGVSAILCGLPECKLILNSNEQLDGRFVKQECLRPFNWQDQDSRMDLIGFLMKLEKFLGGKSIGLSEKEMAHKINYASLGRIGMMWRLVWNASERAMSRGDKNLTSRDLGAAFEELRNDVTRGMDNVFM